MNKTWTIREATIDDAEAIFKLHNEVYQEVYHTGIRPGSLWEGDARSWWQWWMLDNPPGKNHSIIAEDGGKIIAHDAHSYMYITMAVPRNSFRMVGEPLLTRRI